MKNLTPRQVAVIMAFIIALLCFASFMTGVLASHWAWYVFPATLLVFIAMFFLFLTLLHRLIYDRIKPIYKTIHGFDYSNKKQKSSNNTDIITKVNQEVLDFKKNKTLEIEQLKELEKYRKEFLGNVSHELKTPIFNIQGYLLTLLEGGVNDSEINTLYLKKAEKSIDRMVTIVQDLEIISKLEVGVLKLNFSHFNIVKLVEEVYELEQMRASERKIKLLFATDTKKNVAVYADRERILQVINNLVVNALKYGNDKGKIITSISDLNNTVLIEIGDDGIGINNEDLPRIFERFYRVDKSRSRDQGGTGLGLSIVKHIIEAHNQKITVQSEIKKGTTFGFTLSKGKAKYTLN